MTRIVEWAPVAPAAQPLPFGEPLAAHLAAYRNPALREASAAAWTLLACVLAEHGIPAGTLAFTENGKPYFLEGSPWFSLSHAGVLCAVSVADVPTGVDVERCGRAVPPAMIRKCLSPAEKQAFDGDFIRLWCRKESILKLTGAGLSGYPDAVETDDPAYEFTEKIVMPDGDPYRLTAAFAARRTEEANAGKEKRI